MYIYTYIQNSARYSMYHTTVISNDFRADSGMVHSYQMTLELQMTIEHTYQLTISVPVCSIWGGYS